MTSILGRQLAVGKTKIVGGTGNHQTVMIYNTDNVTTKDGKNSWIIPGKGQVACDTTVEVFRRLEKAGIHTHLRGEFPGTPIFFAERLQMIPLEVVFRNACDGSYAKRYFRVARGTEFEEPIIELFYKKDSSTGVSDPLIKIREEKGVLWIDLLAPSDPVGKIIESLQASQALGFDGNDGEARKVIESINSQAPKIAGAITGLFKAAGLYVPDGKIEFGSNYHGFVRLGDVIDAESLRVRAGDFNGEDLSKQVLRDDPSTPVEVLLWKYQRVLNALRSVS